MKNIFKILLYIKPYKFRVIINVCFNLLSVVFGLFAIGAVIPFLSTIFTPEEVILHPGTFEMTSDYLMNYFKYYMYEITVEQGPANALLYIGLTMIIMTFFKTFFKYFAMYNLAPIRNGVPRDIRNRLFEKLLRLPLSYFSNEKKGDIMSRMSGDVQEVEWSLVASIEMLVRDPLTIIITVAVLAMMSIKLTLFVLVLLPVSGLVIGFIGKNLRKTSLKGQRRLGIIVSITEEIISGLRIVKAFNAEERVKRRFKSTNSFYTRLMIKMFRRRYVANPLSEFMGTIVMVIIMWFGAKVVFDGTMSSGALIAYMLVFYTVISPAKSFSSAYYNIQKGLASVDRINEIIDAEETITEKENAKEIKEFKHSIEYRNVSFKYEDEYVLKNINLKIEKGMTVALVGQSGSGKTTMVDLLPRFYDVYEGEVLIDDIPIKELKIKDIRDLMGNVNQEPILFNDTYFNNISFGTYNTSEEEVIKAAKVANAHEFIAETKMGYYTGIGDRGVKMSGGQRQRVSIARAVFKNPPIMILDEATSSLDTKSEKIVQEALNNLMQNRTSLVVAHRLSTIIKADMICVLHEGEIVEKGKHKELLKLNGHYKKLQDLQMFAE